MRPHFGYLLVSAALLADPAQAVMSVVGLPYADYYGRVLSNNITQWLGMRYAKPPTGNRRFRPPEELNHAHEIGKPECAMFYRDQCLVTGNPVGQAGHSEDCLFINVQAPSEATTDSKLPVFVYMQGDGYNNTQFHTNVNATDLLEVNGNDFIVVTFNYRVGPYGYLTHGDGMATNNGIRDQIKALDWVNSYIERFGGDPDHVVLGGSGIGAQNVLIHLTMQKEYNPHFQAIIAESPSFAQMRTRQEAREQYRQFAEQVGCQEKHSLACLVDLPADKIQEATRNMSLSTLQAAPWDMWLPTIDDDLIINSTSKNFLNRHFAKVPFIIGNVVDTGTAFAYRNESSNGDVIEYFQELYPNLLPKDLEEIYTMYSNENGTCDLAACSQGQISNAYQDSRYTCPTLAAVEAFKKAGVEGSYLYLWDVNDENDTYEDLGTRQNVEATALWGAVHGNVPESYKEGGINEAVPFVKQKYWVNFIRSFNPNKPYKRLIQPSHYRAAGKKIKFNYWKPWWVGDRRRFVFRNNGSTKVKDTSSIRWPCTFWHRLSPRMHI